MTAQVCHKRMADLSSYRLLKQNKRFQKEVRTGSFNNLSALTPKSLQRRLRPAGFLDHVDAARAVPHDICRHASQEEPRCRSHALAPDNDEIDLLLVREVDDLVG